MKTLKTLQIIFIFQLLLVTGLFAGSVGGTVYLNNLVGDAKIVAGAELYATNLDSATIAIVHITNTNKDGRYIFEDLPEGTYEFRVNYGDYVHDYLVMDVPAGEIMMELDIYLFKDGSRYGSSVEGTITDNETGAPVASAHVSLAPNGMLPFLLDAFTDENGMYKFYDVPNGTYNLSADKFGYKNYEHFEKIIIEDTTKIVGLDFTMTILKPDASLSGIITNNKTGKAIEGAVISLSYLTTPGLKSDSSIVSPAIIDTSWDNFYFTTKTDENGKYEFDKLYSGEYWLSCSADDFDEIQQPVKIDGTTNLNFSLIPRIVGTISGNVFFDETDNLVENAWIEFIPVTSDRNRYWEFTSTDEFGNYKANVPVGSYYVACSFNTKGPNDYYYYREFFDDVQTISDAKIITVKENEVIENIDFGLATPKEIEIVIKGKVTDDDGKPLVNAMVYLHAEEYFFFSQDSLPTNILPSNAITDSDGIFKLKLNKTILSSLLFKLSAEKEGFITEFYLDKPDWYSADAFKVNNDTTITEINFTLTPYVTTQNQISGNITNTKGLPLSNVFVFGQAINSLDNVQPSIFDSPWAFTDSDGNYTLENLSKQEYIIAFFAKEYIQEFYNDAYTWEEATSIFADGFVTGIDATLDSYIIALADKDGKLNSKNISGIIKDGKNNGLSGVLVTLKNADGKAIGSAQSGSNGSYSIASSSEISSITASKFGYESYSTQIGKNSSAQNFNLIQTVTDVDNKKNDNVPSEFSLEQNYPNPFNPTTTINFNLPSTQNVKLEVYNVIGENVATLVNKSLSAGNHKYEFNATNLNSGLYFYRISAGSFVEVKKMMLLK